MISDLDIYQSAKVIMKQYGKDAQIHSTKRTRHIQKNRRQVFQVVEI